MTAAENDERSCCGCGGPLRGVIGRNFYTCDTPGCGGNVSHYDAVLPHLMGDES